MARSYTVCPTTGTARSPVDRYVTAQKAPPRDCSKKSVSVSVSSRPERPPRILQCPRPARDTKAVIGIWGE
eukprot:scaffold259520_cov35-Tisochrysis_lutea.AAC.6